MSETISMPKLGFDMAEGTLVRWVKAETETIARGEVLAEIETDKATVEVQSTAAGVVLRHLVEQGSVVPVGTPIAVIGAPGESVDAVVPAQKSEKAAEQPVLNQAASPAAPAAPPSGGRLLASPLARQVALERGVDLKGVKGSGPKGRIVRRDVESALAAPAVSTPPPALPSMVPESGGVDERLPVDRLRAAISRRMVESKQQIPHFYLTYEYDVEALMVMRKEINAALPEEEKLSLNDFIVRATSLALRRFPNLNARLEGNEVVRKASVNIGVAVALESGLMTVVCRDADRKAIRQASAEIREMASRARAGKVRPEDIEGSTFSISNLGMYGVEHFIAIINPPEAAILAVGAAKQVPVVAADGSLKTGMRLKATLSADHRLTDGAEAARFMQALGELLEHPVRMLV